ncbi:GGDEF domain-containing protein [Paractinoplanes atraurantiacus]|uniref:Diguanylate cyclase (GGDEF) domain-containing protein n=1 Tax=Paractinoplanes atraurantiacus TaxID=1036182 RepID=A0A285HR01_9ACTN|nr:GGDEF domain-containing protein [Actinoplanes atraurantiacus]SNY37236.1 diguanylate cyclase (GGDEF) domain-containing protein [Actinoplanes atraurantiacus]
MSFRRGWAAVVAAVALGGFLVVPDGGLAQVLWQVGCGWFAAGVIVVGVRLRRPGLPAMWWLLAAGVAGNASGILVEYLLSHLADDPPFPSWADAAYLSLYPAAAVGLLLLIRRRTAHRDLSSLVDAAILTTGIGLLAWVFLIKPAASDPSIGLFGHIVSVAYPVGDIALLAMTARLLLSGGARNTSFRLLGAALLCFLAGDGAWAVINQMVWEAGPMAGKILADVFLAGYLLFGAAALHPSVRTLTRTVAPRSARPSRRLLLMLTVVSLLAPALLIWQAVRHQVDDALAIALGCILLFLLVVTRMSQLITQLDEQTEKIHELAVTDELTGLPNRRAWNTELPRTIERVRRTGDPLAVAIIDIDHFKHFNDAYGHLAGDRLLKEAAAAWQEQLRTADHMARFGGEEFVVMLPAASSAQAREIVDRMRLATPGGQSFSAGVAVWDGAETADALVARADAALYAAKDAGRDRVHEAAHELALKFLD